MATTSLRGQFNFALTPTCVRAKVNQLFVTRRKNFINLWTVLYFGERAFTGMTSPLVYFSLFSLPWIKKQVASALMINNLS